MLRPDDLLAPSAAAVKNNPFRQLSIRTLIYLSVALLTADTIYKTWFGISYQNRNECVLYDSLPRWGFLFYEHFVELLMVVIVGIFAAALLEKYFSRVRPIVPRSSIAAFVYASVVPVCSCSAIPFVKALHDRVPFRVIITFVVAAPLLNPYIVMISLTVLGVEYALLRIACSLVLATFTGVIAERFYLRMKEHELGTLGSCASHNGCPSTRKNIYEATFTTFRKVLPFMLFAGALSVAVELAGPGSFLTSIDLTDGFVGTALVILVGVPVYFCNGADVLFLQPLIENAGLPLGTAMAFSLTSTSVCITSLAMLLKFVGRKLTLVILVSIVLMTILLSLGINIIMTLLA